MSPPTRSTASAISSAERSAVPLKRRCSRKWDAPARASGSSRAPTCAHTPTATDGAWGRSSVTTRRPSARVLERIRSLSDASRRPRPPRSRPPPRPPRSRPPPLRGGSSRAEVTELGLELGLELVLEGDPHGAVVAVVGAGGVIVVPAGATVASRSRSRDSPRSRSRSPPRSRSRDSPRSRSPRSRDSRGAGASPSSSPPPCSPSGVRLTLPSGSMSSTRTWMASPRDTTSSTRSMRRLPPSLEMWTRPSRPGRMLTKAPNLVMLTTLPS